MIEALAYKVGHLGPLQATGQPLGYISTVKCYSWM